MIRGHRAETCKRCAVVGERNVERGEGEGRGVCGVNYRTEALTCKCALVGERDVERGEGEGLTITSSSSSNSIMRKLDGRGSPSDDTGTSSRDL